MGFLSKLFGGGGKRSGGGPKVKTGPTRGQVRSRNSNGQWRGKRNDAGHRR